jgi:hypothetical protein
MDKFLRHSSTGGQTHSTPSRLLGFMRHRRGWRQVTLEHFASSEAVVVKQDEKFTTIKATRNMM